MECRHCGTEIADKAIVCYRCGAGTTDPVRAPAPVGRRGGRRPSLGGPIVLLIAALILFIARTATGHVEMMTAAAVACGFAGLVALVVALARRR